MKAASLLPTSLGAKFRFALLVPVAVPLVVLEALSLAGAPKFAPSLPRLLESLNKVDAAQLAGATVVFALCCILVAPIQLPLIRFLEGYWGAGRLARALIGVGIRRQRRQMSKLRSASQMQTDIATTDFTPSDIASVSRAAQLLRQRFPAADDLLPTALGNVLRAAERRAGARYGFDAIVLWPRLHVILPSHTRTAVNDAREELDLLAGLTVSFVATAVVALAFTGQHGWWLTLPLVFVLLSAVSYRGAVASAIRFGTMVAVAFDLHRFELLTALHIPLPADSAAERALYSSLEKVLRGIPEGASGALPTLRYAHPEPAKASATTRPSDESAQALTKDRGADTVEAGSVDDADSAAKTN